MLDAGLPALPGGDFIDILFDMHSLTSQRYLDRVETVCCLMFGTVSLK